jgi:hypothetical protein
MMMKCVIFKFCVTPHKTTKKTDKGQKFILEKLFSPREREKIETKRQHSTKINISLE